MFMTISCFGQDQDTTNRTINGVKEGYWKEYSEDSPTVFEGEYKNGKRDGDWYLISTKDGTKLDLQKYNNGKKAGGATLSW